MSIPSIKASGTSPIEAISDMLESIAMEEAGLALIIHAQGENIQKTNSTCWCESDMDTLARVNQSISDTLSRVAKLQILLEFKLERIERLIDKIRDTTKESDKCTTKP